jgi:hypothetical protein
VETYDGDVDQTARKCGLTSREANLLLRRVEIRTAIRNRELVDNPNRQSFAVTSRLEREEFLSALMRDKVQTENGAKQPIDMQMRMKALELLGKMNGDFVEKHEHSGPNGGPLMNAVVHVDLPDLAERVRMLKARRVAPELEFLS